jgi:hypothetical protein
MTCFNITKYGFTTIEEILADVVSEMTGVQGTAPTAPMNTIPYFEKKFGMPGVPTVGAGSTSVNVVVLKATVHCDPLANVAQVGQYITNTEPGWRICFNNIDENRLAVHVATDLQLSDNGTIAQLNDRALPTPAFKEPAGNVGEDWTGAGGTPVSGAAGFNQIWLNREPDVDSEAAYPMSYTLTMTNRGLFFGIWEDSQEEVPQGTFDTALNPNPDGAYGRSPLRWLLVQRSVDRLTGHVRGGGAMRQDNDPMVEMSRCPVFCVSGASAPQKFQKFIVREVDVPSPSRKKYAAVQSEDQAALLNPYPQQSLTETGEFVVTFMNNLGTSRYKYADELDMLGTVAAEVVGAGTSVLVSVYGEPFQREYTALYATERYGTGMRLMVLTRMGYDPEASPEVNATQNEQVENSHRWYTP